MTILSTLTADEISARSEQDAAIQAAASALVAEPAGMRVRVLSAAKGSILDDEIILEGSADVPLSIEIDTALPTAALDYLRALAERDVPQWPAAD